MLEIRNLKKQFNHQLIFNNLNLKIEGCMMLGIIGKTGRGKTTLLNILGGNDSDYEGEVLFNGINVKDYSDPYRRNYVGFFFQQSLMLSNWSIKDNLEIDSMLFGFKKNYQSFFDQLALSVAKNNKVKQLSGGQIQRLSCIRALNKFPSILLCDEPTSALDYQNSIKMMELLKLHSKQAIVIVVSHNEQLLRNFCDNILDLNQSQLENYYFKGTTPLRLNSVNERSKKNKLRLVLKSIKVRKQRNVLTSFAIGIGTFLTMMTLLLSGQLKKEVINELGKIFPQNCISLRFKDLTYHINENKAKEIIQYARGGYLNLPLLEFDGISTNSLEQNYLFIPDQSKIISDKTSLKFGRFPLNENEILLSENTYQRLFQNQIGEQEVYGLYRYNNQEVKTNLKVVGVVNEHTNMDTIYRNSLDELTLVKKLFNLENVSGDYLMLYLDTDPNQIIENLKNRYTDMEFKIVGETTLQKVEKILDYVSYFLYFLTVFVLISIFLLLGMSVYLSITEKLKEMGLFRLLGASKNDVVVLQILEVVLISIFGILVGMLVNFLVIDSIGMILNDVLGFNLHFMFSFFDLVNVGSGLLLLSVISSLYPILKTKQYAILDLIKQSDL